MARRLYCLLALLAVLLPGAAASGAEYPITAWLREHLIALRTDDPGTGTEDLVPLEKLVGTASVVSLGEATHGTHEFFRLKHRLVQLLASRMKFTVFAIEANLPDAYRLNEYVVHGKGDPAQLVRRMNFWTWDTQEILDLVVWMHDFNLSGKGTIKIAGFDFGDPKPALANLQNFLAEHDPATLTSLNGAAALVSQAQTRAGMAALDAHAAAAIWERVVADLETAAPRYLQMGIARDEVEWATRNAVLIRQFFEMRAGEFTRDSSMAENVRWIRDHAPGERIILWAHNGHVAVGGAIVGPESMGTKLRHLYGRNMITFGFSFNEGSFRALSVNRRAVVNHRVPPAPPGSLDAALASPGVPLFVIDLRTLPASGPVAVWFSQRHKSREIGAEYADYSLFDQMYDLDVRASFDAIVFAARTTASIPITR